MTNVTPEYVAEIIEKFEVADENKQRGVMGIEGNLTPFFCPFSQTAEHFRGSNVVLWTLSKLIDQHHLF